MNEPIEETYFNWLCAKVLSPPRSSMYIDILRVLHSTEFVWVLEGDDNRAEDGMDLRYDFLTELQIGNEEAWFHVPSSILEVLIAFAKRANFQTDIPVKDWFWTFMQNLELDEYRTMTEDDMPNINSILHDFVWRQYGPSGHGGMFPLRWPKRDQSKVEIWYQFCEYLDEQGMD